MICLWVSQSYSEDKSSKCVLKGQEIIERIDETFSNGTDKYLKYISTKDLTVLSEAEPYEYWSFRRIHKDGMNDSLLNVPVATLINYLDRHHREELEVLLSKILPQIKEHCFEGKLFTSTCSEATNIFGKYIAKVMNNIEKFGFLTYKAGEYHPYSFNNWLDNLIKDIDGDFYIKYNDELAWLDIW